MSFIDPTYLRYIVDELNSGTLSGESSTSLPDGLVGVYEESFESLISLNSKKKVFSFFTVWALLKKDASVSFVAQVLVSVEKDVFDLISKYSSWFNSPSSGKYQLYHERFRIYILEKVAQAGIDKYIKIGRASCRERVLR